MDILRRINWQLCAAAMLLAASAFGVQGVQAATTDISTVPLGTAPTTSVLPNLMFVLDNSGSMAQDYTPDQTNDDGTCKLCDGVGCNMTGDSCKAGFPPFYAAAFNTQYYNPNVTYKAGVNHLGASLGDQTAASAKNNPYIASDTSTFNLETSYRDIWWCNLNLPRSSDYNDPAKCRRNGFNNPFNWTTNTINNGFPNQTGTSSSSYRFGFARDVSSPVYYVISPLEYCTDLSLTVCTSSTVPVTIASVVYDKPAPVRWCRTTAAPSATAPVTGGSPATCRANVDSVYRYPRFGTFTRFDIVSGTTTYPRATSRSDCTGAFGATGCTYAEELRNFANWYSYYRTRMLQMKTVSGRVFAGLDERYRVGFLTINASNLSQYLKIAKFETSPTTHKQNWFTKFYAQVPGSGTPLREALSRVGRHYAGKTDGINSFMPDDPVQYACQRNYTLLTTDGYWNGASGDKIDSSTVGNEDNIPGPFVSRATGTLDGIGTVVTQSTPTSTLRQQICTGNASTTFPVDNTTCGCKAGQTRVKQQTSAGNTNVTFTDGGTGVTTAGATIYTYQDITACTTPLIVQSVILTTRVDEQVLTGNSNSAFPTVNGVSTGKDQAGTCGARLVRTKQRTTTYTTRTVTTDGIVTSTSVIDTPQANYSFANLGTCVTPATRQTTTRIEEVSQWAGRGASRSPMSSFPTAANGNSAQTAVDARCSDGQQQRWRKTLQYDKVDTQTGSGPITTTYANPGTPAFTRLDACRVFAPNAAGTTFATVSGPITVVTSGGPDPVAAASTVTDSVTTATNNGGTTVAIALVPNPSVPVTGATTSTTTFGGASGTLSDVAMYYYKTDLRPTMADIVKAPNGTFLHQHMVTFTLGLGLDGQMIYDPNYETATSGDFFKIKSSATTCPWTTGTCNWPVPAENTPTAIDDLWHAAVNGRGKYFSAKDPTSLENGLSDTLNSINIATGAAASAATSTPNLTPTDNLLFSSNYRTQKWDGEVIAQRIDAVTGDILPTIEWSGRTQLNLRSSGAADTRTIYTFSASDTTKVKPFLYANLSAAEQAFFNGKCASVSALPQCGPFDPARVTAANLGTNLVNWLRGQRGNELNTDSSSGLYRARDFILGDLINSKPVFVGPPNKAFADAVTPDYPTFRTANANRQKALFIAANDGMLHALNSDTGAELWAYVPRMIMPNLWRLAKENYEIAHEYFVDGSPTVTDMFFPGSPGQWKTILVGGMNAGGRGYYALDITDPANPKGLWEICADATLCNVVDADMGLSHGVPILTKRHDGTPIVVVTSGYNNVSPGNGGGYLYVLNAATGAVLEKIGTTVSASNVGNSVTPSGLAKISGFAPNSAVDNTATLIYGGDLLGNLWRFDMTATPVVAKRIAQLKDANSPGRPQSITTSPEISRFTAGFNVVYVGTGRYLGASDLGDPMSLTPPEPFAYQQTIYAIKDTNTDLGDARAPAANLVQQVMGGTVTARTVSNNEVDYNSKNGWYLDLNPANTSPGERVNLDMTLLGGVLTVLGNQPNSQVCSEGANGFAYKLDYRSGSAIAGAGGLIGGQVSSSALVGAVFYRTTSGAVIGQLRTSGGGSIKSDIPQGSGSVSGQRVSWRELLQ